MLTETLPVLETERLVLRPYSLADAQRVQEMCGDWAVASTTLALPHPYPDGAAEQWISTHGDSFRQGSEVTLAVTTHLTRNPASGRVMQKLGMSREGLLRQYVLNRGVFDDLVMYSILRSDFETTGKAG